MTDFLLFTVYAPLSSWGDIAPGELRGSWDRPSRSAVLGLLGAALGVERSDQAAHEAMDVGYGIAVRQDLLGTPAIDYHTAQTLPASHARRLPVTTRQALLKDHRLLQTILSRRSFRQDAISTIGVWANGAERWSLQDLKVALDRPHFVLYAGRKSHVLALPAQAEIVSAPTLAAAFRKRAVLPERVAQALHRLKRSNPPEEVEVSHDPCEGFDSGLTPVRQERRRDTGAHRGRWQFQERMVEVGVVPEEQSA